MLNIFKVVRFQYEYIAVPFLIMIKNIVPILQHICGNNFTFVNNSRNDFPTYKKYLVHLC